MLFQLMDTGSLWPWEWPVFITCVLILVIGPTAIWIIWTTNRRAK